MKRLVVISVTLLALLLAAPVSFAQICGDVDGDGYSNVGDMVSILDHIAQGYPFTPEEEARADCDDRLGVTIGDASAMCDWMFLMEGELDCTPALSYTFALSPNDTVFLPRMLQIPDGIDTVLLPIRASFEESTHGFYMPYRSIGAGTGDAFQRVYFANGTDGPFVSFSRSPYDWEVDSSIVYGTRTEHGALVNEEVIQLKYGRTSAGHAGISLDPFDRDDLWRFCIDKDGDLYVPVFVYYDVELPVSTLSASVSAVGINGTSGVAASEQAVVDFSASEYQVTFDLTATAPWIRVDGAVGGTFTTPASVAISADATELFAGVYTGQVAVTNLVPPAAESSIDFIDVTFTVTDAATYPHGDLDCDGIVSMGDLTTLIYYLFLNPGPIPPCE